MIKNMIFLEKNNASVIRHRGDKLEFIKKDGEVDFPITIDFWEWWKRAVSYVNGDKVDLCLIYDKEYDLLQDSFLGNLEKVSKEETVWNEEYIKSFFWELKPTYFNVCLSGPDGENFYLEDNNNPIQQKRYYTNIILDTKKCIAKEKEENPKKENKALNPIDENDISPIAKYFVDLIHSERRK